MSVERWLKVSALILLAVTFAACGSAKSSGSSNQGGDKGLSAAEGTGPSGGASATGGKVGLLLKDTLEGVPGPPSITLPAMSQVWVTVTKVSLKAEGSDESAASDGGSEGGGDGWLTVFEGSAKYDLLALQGDSAALMALASVPADKAGYYSEARLELDTADGQNCFYKSPDGAADDPSAPCTDSDAIPLIVPSGKIDIVFQPHIYLGQNSTQYIVFDFLPADSIKIEFPEGIRTHVLMPVIHAYTMPAIMETNDWQHVKIEKVEGIVESLSGCDDPNAPDILVLSHINGNDSADMTMDITNATIFMGNPEATATCGSIHTGQEVKVKILISSDGTIVAEHVIIPEG